MRIKEEGPVHPFPYNSISPVCAKNSIARIRSVYSSLNLMAGSRLLLIITRNFLSPRLHKSSRTESSGVGRQKISDFSGAHKNGFSDWGSVKVNTRLNDF